MCIVCCYCVHERRKKNQPNPNQKIPPPNREPSFICFIRFFVQLFRMRCVCAFSSLFSALRRVFIFGLFRWLEPHFFFHRFVRRMELLLFAMREREFMWPEQVHIDTKRNAPIRAIECCV